MALVLDADITPADLEERALWHLELEDRACWLSGADLYDGEVEEFDDDPWNDRDTTCRECNGTGGDPWNDGITPCEACDGEGYRWWM